MGQIDKDETTVCYITGNGLKATESIMQVLSKTGQVMQARCRKNFCYCEVSWQTSHLQFPSVLNGGIGEKKINLDVRYTQ